MKKENQIALTIGLMLFAYGMGVLSSRRQMYQAYGDVMSAEALMYLAHRDNEA